jgi:hypothetical protein
VPSQVAFMIDELSRRIPTEPELAADPMVQAALAGDLAKLMAGKHYDGLMRVAALTHAGMTTDVFQATVEEWFAAARHPKYGRPYGEVVYQPMLELLGYLRANGFKDFIVSGGGADFMRVWVERIYGIPPEQVVGSTARTVFELGDSGPVLTKTLDQLFVDDTVGKPVGIWQFIGRRPIACFGNSDGDQAMLQYTTINNPRPSYRRRPRVHLRRPAQEHWQAGRGPERGAAARVDHREYAGRLEARVRLRAALSGERGAARMLPE